MDFERIIVHEHLVEKQRCSPAIDVGTLTIRFPELGLCTAVKNNKDFKRSKKFVARVGRPRGVHYLDMAPDWVSRATMDPVRIFEDDGCPECANNHD